MNTAMTGLMAGLALGFAGYFGGLAAFVVVVALGLVGMVIGHLAGRELHATDFVRLRDGRGRRGSFGGERTTRAHGPRTEHGPRRRLR
ncbi:hypothetical protein [Streptomyces collinus]